MAFETLHWLQFWQLRTWIHDNLWDLTFKSDTGQHSQFLRCLSYCHDRLYVFLSAQVCSTKERHRELNCFGRTYLLTTIRIRWRSHTPCCSHLILSFKVTVELSLRADKELKEGDQIPIQFVVRFAGMSLYHLSLTMDLQTGTGTTHKTLQRTSPSLSGTWQTQMTLPSFTNIQMGWRTKTRKPSFV